MNAEILVVLVVVLVSSAFSLPAVRMKRWSTHQEMVMPAPGLPDQELKRVLALTPDIRYNDREKNLTALKNSKSKACFIVDLDPDFHLSEPGMDTIATERAAEAIDTPPAYYAFLKKAGPFLTAMCQDMDIYWLNTQAPPFPVDGNRPDRNQGPVNHNPPTPPPSRHNPPTPPPVHHNPPTPPPVHHNPPTPPPVHHNPPTPPPSRHNPPTPPPVAMYRQQQRDRNVMTPPPLSVFRQQQANQNVRQVEQRTPPPLDMWRLRHGH